MKSQNSMNHKTYVVASEASDGPWSLAYVSQVYGTIFGVYTNIEIVKKGDRNICRRIHFKLGNFKGLIMLGITKVNVRTQSDPVSGNKGLLIDLEVKGLETTREHTVDLIDQGITIEEGTLMELQRHLAPLHKHLAEDGGLFDTEFYYRDSPQTNVVEFAQHAPAYHAYKSGQASEIREAALSEYTPICILAQRFIKIE